MNVNKVSLDTLKNQGNLAFHKKDYQKAINLYSEGIKSFPENPIFYLNRALVYLSMHFFQESLADLSLAKLLDPQNPKIFYRTALAYQLLGEYQKAIETIQEFFTYTIESTEIFELYQELNEKKDTFIKPQPSERKKFDDLFRWSSMAGGEFPKIYLEYYSQDYRGIHCYKDLAPEECIIFIPYHHLITLQVTKENPLARKLVQNDFELNYGTDSFFAAFLLNEQSNPDSFWSPYINILPKSFENFPIFFTESEKKYLVGSPFLKIIRDRLVILEEEYKAICQIDKSFMKYSLGDFCKARMTVNSRIFGISINNKETDVLVPVADMINHQKDRNASWTYSNERNGFLVKSERPIGKGEQIFDTYGTKSNSRYFLSYGFIQDSNNYDNFPYIVQLHISLPHYRTKISYLRENYVMVYLRAELDQRFLDFLSCIRFYEETNEEKINEFISQCMSSNIRIDPTKYKPSSIETEKLAIKKFINLTEYFLSMYPTSLDADKEKLKENLTENVRNCIKIIVSEKEVLTFYLSILPNIYRLIDLEPIVNTLDLSPSLKYYTEKVLTPLHI
jgi:protein-histidine N-methyltransferase